MGNLTGSAVAIQLDPREAMLKMVNGYMLSQCIYVAAKLGVADLLHERPGNAGELAEATGADPRSLYRVLRTLASAGIFAEDADSCFRLTPMGEVLRTSVRDSVRDWAVFRGDQTVWRPWGAILHSVQTGSPAFEHVFGKGIFEYLGENPQAAGIFDGAMRSISDRRFRAVAKAYPLEGVGTIVDVGGGTGGLIAALLKTNSGLRGVVAELPHVLDRARKALAAEGLGERSDCISTEMFEAVPSGGDAYVLGHIIHDWDDKHAIQILDNCRRAMRPGGRVLLVEMVLPAENESHLAHLVDIEMLVMTDGGRERTREEYDALYASAGLQLSRVVPTDSWWSVLEGFAA